jgi:hypothetical protein
VDIVVDPARMLSVTIEAKPKEGDPLSRFFPGTETISAITCGYVIGENPDGSVGVALDIVYDAENTHPTSVYLLPLERVTRVLVAPARVLNVTTYRY